MQFFFRFIFLITFLGLIYFSKSWLCSNNMEMELNLSFFFQGRGKQISNFKFKTKKVERFFDHILILFPLSLPIYVSYWEKSFTSHTLQWYTFWMQFLSTYIYIPTNPLSNRYKWCLSTKRRKSCSESGFLWSTQKENLFKRSSDSIFPLIFKGTQTTGTVHDILF